MLTSNGEIVAEGYFTTYGITIGEIDTLDSITTYGIVGIGTG
jgi:hypothetical protein